MRVLDIKSKNRTIDYNKLLKYGFIKSKNGTYKYIKRISNGQFKMIVIVENNKMISKLIDLVNEDEYVLVDIQDSTGKFVGKVREEYENEIQNIITKCANFDMFKSKQAKEIIKYVKEKYDDDLEYLWEKFPQNAIWRNKENNKWYGALMVLSKRKLGINSDETIDIIDLRYQKDLIKKLIDNDKIFTGYHMNKNSWFTIKLDNSVENKKIFDLIDNSYNLSLKK